MGAAKILSFNGFLLHCLRKMKNDKSQCPDGLGSEDF